MGCPGLNLNPWLSPERNLIPISVLDLERGKKKSKSLHMLLHTGQDKGLGLVDRVL